MSKLAQSTATTVGGYITLNDTKVPAVRHIPVDGTYYHTIFIEALTPDEWESIKPDFIKGDEKLLMVHTEEDIFEPKERNAEWVSQLKQFNQLIPQYQRGSITVSREWLREYILNYNTDCLPLSSEYHSGTSYVLIGNMVYNVNPQIDGLHASFKALTTVLWTETGISHE